MEPKRPLSEISHLFLSEIRSRQPQGVRPTRIAPPKIESLDIDPPQPQSRKIDHSVDMTPEEFAASLEGGNSSLEAGGLLDDAAPDEDTSTQNSIAVSVILSAHLNGRASQGVQEYARFLAAETGRIGLIEADNGHFALSYLELSNESPVAPPATLHTLNVREISETLNELAVDVDRWIISLPNAKSAESREILRSAPHWAVLTTADHEGVVATYRTLKGLAELGHRRISLVVLDARDDAHAGAVFRKLDAVSRQFLHTGLEAGLPLRPVQNVTEHQVLICTQGQDAKAQVTASGPHWRVIAQFLSDAVAPPMDIARIDEIPNIKEVNEPAPTMKLNIAETNIPEPTMAEPMMTEPASEMPRKNPRAMESLAEVIDLPEDAGERGILDAVVRQGGAEGRWILCPIHPPMCPQTVLAIGRDQRLMLLAVAGRGLGQLLSIGQALRWVSENIELIKMALPQLAIDARAIPCIKLLVDHNDLSAEILQPMLQEGTIQVQAYRKVRWGGKTGLLLEAA